MGIKACCPYSRSSFMPSRWMESAHLLDFAQWAKQVGAEFSGWWEGDSNNVDRAFYKPVRFVHSLLVLCINHSFRHVFNKYLYSLHLEPCTILEVGDERMTITDKVLVPRGHSSREGSRWCINKQGNFRFRWGMGWPVAHELAFYEDCPNGVEGESMDQSGPFSWESELDTWSKLVR